MEREMSKRDSRLMATNLLALYEERGRILDHIRRFYLHLDLDIYDVELQVEESEAAGYFRDRLIDLYESWLREMTPEQRAGLFTHNRLAGGANTNWLVVDEERLRRYESDLLWDEERSR
jgi:hypothetical protein